MIKVLSTGCPKCNVLKKKLVQEGIEFELVEDPAEVMKVADEVGKHSAPLLILDDGSVLEFTEANKWLMDAVTCDACKI